MVKKSLKHHINDIIKIKTSPHSIALGFAIGAFIAILPTVGIGILLGIIIIFLFKKVSKLSLFGAMLVFNPLILAPIYYLSYQLGNLILGNAPKQEFDLSLYNMVYHLSARFLLGNVILAVVFSLLSYYIVKNIAQKYQEKK